MLIIETATFTAQISALLDESSYRALQNALVDEPARGVVIADSAPAGGGRVEMKAELFEQLLGSVKEGGALLRGERAAGRVTRIDEPDAAAVRSAYRLSQGEFAALLGISVRTLQNWEQGRRRPRGPARVLLRVAAKHPEAVLDAVAGTESRRTSASTAQRSTVQAARRIRATRRQPRR